MSGGYFDHKDWLLDDFAEDIEQIIRNNDSTELDEWGDRIGCNFSPETIQKFRLAVEYLRVARVYVRRIDYLMSGDHSEDTFQKYLAEELELAKRISEHDPS